jgi:two-component system chemotaxis sensor kinase CheA
LSLERRGERVRIALTDDGRGMDPPTLRRKAVELGLITRAEAEALGETDTLMLATLPGVSTAEELSLISGRGVGLDVVRHAVETLRGQMLVRSRPGHGTRIELSVPLHLALIQALLFRHGGGLYAVPIDAVRRAANPLDPGLPDAAAPIRVALPGAALPGTRSRRELLLNGEPALSLLVDELVGRQDLVVQPFPRPLAGLAAYSGAAIAEDGSVALILDPFRLAAATAPA